MLGQIARDFEGVFLVNFNVLNTTYFFSIFPLTKLMSCCFFLAVPESNNLEVK